MLYHDAYGECPYCVTLREELAQTDRVLARLYWHCHAESVGDGDQPGLTVHFRAPARIPGLQHMDESGLPGRGVQPNLIARRPGVRHQGSAIIVAAETG